MCYRLRTFAISIGIGMDVTKQNDLTPCYCRMAPEVAAVERKGGYNQQCDVWAVGIVGIEFAELQPPMFDLHPMRYNVLA